MPKRPLYKRILIWRAKHISHKQFVYILSIIVGFTSGVGAGNIEKLNALFSAYT